MLQDLVRGMGQLSAVGTDSDSGMVVVVRRLPSVLLLFAITLRLQHFVEHRAR